MIARRAPVHSSKAPKLKPMIDARHLVEDGSISVYRGYPYSGIAFGFEGDLVVETRQYVNGQRVADTTLDCFLPSGAETMIHRESPLLLDHAGEVFEFDYDNMHLGPYLDGRAYSGVLVLESRGTGEVYALFRYEHAVVAELFWTDGFSDPSKGCRVNEYVGEKIVWTERTSANRKYDTPRAVSYEWSDSGQLKKYTWRNASDYCEAWLDEEGGLSYLHARGESVFDVKEPRHGLERFGSLRGHDQLADQALSEDSLHVTGSGVTSDVLAALCRSSDCARSEMITLGLDVCADSSAIVRMLISLPRQKLELTHVDQLDPRSLGTILGKVSERRPDLDVQKIER